MRHKLKIHWKSDKEMVRAQRMFVALLKSNIQVDRLELGARVRVFVFGCLHWCSPSLTTFRIWIMCTRFLLRNFLVFRWTPSFCVNTVRFDFRSTKQLFGFFCDICCIPNESSRTGDSIRYSILQSLKWDTSCLQTADQIALAFLITSAKTTNENSHHFFLIDGNNKDTVSIVL